MKKGFFVIFINNINFMIFGILLVVGILIFFLVRWFFVLETKLISKNEFDDEPFELTELSKMTPTPTPIIEKKKRGRKPKKN